MTLISSNEIRSKFSALMSEMYKNEVPLYGDLLELVQDVNQTALSKDIQLQDQLKMTGEFSRLSLERHGAIRLGTADELHNMARIFAVMGMEPVGYYDLVPAGVPVHATAFRAVKAQDLNQSPFRIFTSLLRLELIKDEKLRQLAEQTLAKRQIFTEQALALTKKFEQQEGLSAVDAEQFVHEVLETFRWHTQAPVTKALYDSLHEQHRLIADVVAFKGPHINHLTPRTLDIDQIQSGMMEQGMSPKAVIEGPPRRKCPILLRQTSFKALEEKVAFAANQGQELGTHTARFGEIEQRGVALTPKGRQLYDELLGKTRQQLGGAPTEHNAQQYMELLAKNFEAFPDSYAQLRQQKLAYFYYFPLNSHCSGVVQSDDEATIETLIEQGSLRFEPIVYEDFLPVSAAGIFQSNLGESSQTDYATISNLDIFEQSLGRKVINEIALYEAIQQDSLQQALAQLSN
ncbi:2-oxoadipate dioxygenase/decarboxylase HglS [Acinetobacter rudis]|uniref:2-oxoadipate dioxygenase/decarboxylase HglS n=1 Tax=Acinetobacter rudis TaxID=632955 RepID=UPI003340BB4A